MLDDLLNILASSVGGLTNPTKLANTFESVKHERVSHKTISSYLEYLCDSFILERAERYDIKGKQYIESPYKYYFIDEGLRNARLNFRGAATQASAPGQLDVTALRAILQALH